MSPLVGRRCRNIAAQRLVLLVGNQNDSDGTDAGDESDEPVLAAVVRLETSDDSGRDGDDALRVLADL
jgi:hypothetical protein